MAAGAALRASGDAAVAPAAGSRGRRRQALY